jgi:D-alanine-D-alanine ligase
MTKKIRVGILFGGKSAEHEVSIQSAKNVYNALDRSKYDPVLIGIDRQGTWHLHDGKIFSLTAYSQEVTDSKDSSSAISIDPGALNGHLIPSSGLSEQSAIDVIFPILHGTYGEDGTVAGMLKLLDIPFVGASVLGSAVGMDKDVMKKLLTVGDLPICNHMVFEDFRRDGINYKEITDALGEPFFVKPANMGSSVGVSKVKNEKECRDAIDLAFSYDRKILIEQYIPCEEIEVSVLGNENPIASVPGRIIPNHEFYSYDAKYLDEDGALLEIPADVADVIKKEVQELAIKAYKALYCEGMARVDFFLHKETKKLYVNEINTIPGFTKISMYPKLWEASGIDYTELVSRLIELALDRHQKEKQLLVTR